MSNVHASRPNNGGWESFANVSCGNLYLIKVRYVKGLIRYYIFLVSFISLHCLSYSIKKWSQANSPLTSHNYSSTVGILDAHSSPVMSHQTLHWSFDSLPKSYYRSRMGKKQNKERSALLAICVGNPSADRCIPSQRTNNGESVALHIIILCGLEVQ